MITVFVIPVRKLARVNLFTFRWHSDKVEGVQKYIQTYDEREKEKKHTEEKALNGYSIDNAQAGLTRDPTVWQSLSCAFSGAVSDKDMETPLKNYIVPVSR